MSVLLLTPLLLLFPSSTYFDVVHPGDSPELMTKASASEFEYHYRSTESKKGTFSSHDQFPNAYANDVTIRHVFQAQKDERVQIVFIEFELNRAQEDTTQTECEGVDSVTVIIIIDDKPRQIGVYCGIKRPPQLMSNAQRMDIVFISHSFAKDAKGFRANFSFVTDFGIKSGEQDSEHLCRFTFRSKKASNGTFTSPNYPGLYPCNTECHYLFYGDEGERVHITFPYFDVEGIPPQCYESTESDFVELSNFNIEVPDRKMNRLCGTKDQHQHMRSGLEVRSDGSFFRVSFKSNGAFDATGFEAFYQFMKPELVAPDKKAQVDSRSSLSLAPSLRLTAAAIICISALTLLPFRRSTVTL